MSTHGYLSQHITPDKEHKIHLRLIHMFQIVANIFVALLKWLTLLYSHILINTISAQSLLKFLSQTFKDYETHKVIPCIISNLC